MSEPTTFRGRDVNLIACIVMLISGLFGLVFGYDFAERSYKAQAIKANAAHYEVDAQTGETRFVWNKQAEKQ